MLQSFKRKKKYPLYKTNKTFFFLIEKNKTVKLREKEKEKKSNMDNLKEVSGYLSNIM